MRKTKNYFLIILLFAANSFWGLSKLNAQITADFTAKEAAKKVYHQNFDSYQELEKWEIIKVTDRYDTWDLGHPQKTGIPQFSNINPESKYSLLIKFSDDTSKDDIIRSEKFTVNPSSFCSFYACFDGVFTMYANLILEVESATDPSQVKEIFNAFMWSQETGHERPKWMYFTVDLSEFSGQEVHFRFRYKGIGGDDVLIDDFIISETGGNSVEILEGEKVNFLDASTVGATEWLWAFEGGIPNASTEQNPVVTYPLAGNYKVTLKVKNSEGVENEITKEGYVAVKGVAPTAQIGFPENAYLSPYCGIFIPRNTDVTFYDKSKNQPTSWRWAFEGGTPNTSTEQNPVIKYENKGKYSISLASTNNQGTNFTQLLDYVQAGDSMEVWNMEVEESDGLASIELGWYGYYGGTNWLDMAAFAEGFHAPALDAYLTEVSVFFDKTTAVTADAPISVEIYNRKNGLPNELLASSTLSAGELMSSAEEWIPTIFKLEQPVLITDSFFVAVKGFPNEEGDDIAMGSIRRLDRNAKNTAYHYLELLDESYNPTGVFEWLKSDENVSFAICPKLVFANDIATSLPTAGKEQPEVFCVNPIVENTLQFIHTENILGATLYDIAGHAIINLSGSSIKRMVRLPYTLQSGLYILNVNTDTGIRSQSLIVR